MGSTERAAGLGDEDWKLLLSRHDAVIARQIERFRGRKISTAGDSFLATFDGPARAIRCAQAIIEEVRGLGLEVRAGLHTGEIELVGDDIQGIAVHIAARVSAKAAAGEVLVSSTVRDLVAGSGIAFEDRGWHQLKGVPEPWKIYAVRGPSAQQAVPAATDNSRKEGGNDRQPGLQMGQRRHVLEAAIGERGAVVALGGGRPAEHTAQAVVVVVANEAGQCILGIGGTRKVLPVKHLGLQHCPEGLDLAVGPWRADLYPQVLNVQMSQPLAKSCQHVGHPDDEGQAVVSHQLQGMATELKHSSSQLKMGSAFVSLRMRSPITNRE